MKISFQELIKTAAPGTTLRDAGEKGSVKGLQLRALRNKKVFMLYYRSKQGVQRRPRLGDYGAITLGQARDIARGILDRVARGEDPQADWGKARSEITVEALFELVLKSHWSKARYEKSGRKKHILCLFRNQIGPAFGSKKISSITRPEVIAWHRDLEYVAPTANRALEVLNQMYTFAEEESILPRGSNPCWRIKAFPEIKRKRYASVEELVKIIQILEREKEKHPRRVAFIYVLMFTGSRPKAIARATVDQLTVVETDGSRYGVLSFHGKTSSDSGENEVVIVPPIALEIIESYPRTDSRLFASTIPSLFWRKVRKEADCEDLWLRDLRRTFATVGMSSGINKDIIGKLLNHSSSQTTDLYAKLDMGARIQAAGLIADRIGALGKSNVVPLKKVSDQ